MPADWQLLTQSLLHHRTHSFFPSGERGHHQQTLHLHIDRWPLARFCDRLNTRAVYPLMVTHPSTNPAQCRLASLMCATPLAIANCTPQTSLIVIISSVCSIEQHSTPHQDSTNCLHYNYNNNNNYVTFISDIYKLTKFVKISNRKPISQ